MSNEPNGPDEAAEPDAMEWTDEEREALDALSREVDPGRLLEERTVAALKERGLLEADKRTAPPLHDDEAGSSGRGSTNGRTGSHRTGRFGGPFHPAWWAAGIAAALAIFFAGLAAGQTRAGVSADELMIALRSAEAAERPSLIQQTGSLYVDAIASLATTVDDRETVGTGVEVGLTALYAAAYELARLHPEDPRLQQVLDVLERPQTDGDPETDVHWF